jgi:hypothetical protein
MSEAQVRSGSDAASAGALALAVLCTQQFIMAYDTVSMNVAISTIVVDLKTSLLRLREPLLPKRSYPGIGPLCSPTSPVCCSEGCSAS